MDLDLRELERAVKRDPSDESARLALALGLLRAGKETEAREAARADSREGYAALARAACSEPAVGPLLDGSPEWRSSGGDPGCTRWAKALPVTRPRTAWRRRIEGIHAALAMCVDRGRAFVLCEAPGKNMELVALSVMSGETLWRFSLGEGAAAAPAARDGRVYVATIEHDDDEPSLRVIGLRADSGKRLWKRVSQVWSTPPDTRPRDWRWRSKNLLPGAVNVSGKLVLLAIATSSRGLSTPPDRSLGGGMFAFLLGGEFQWTNSRWNTSVEIACLEDRVFQCVWTPPGSGGLVLERNAMTGGEGSLVAVLGERIAATPEHVVVAGSALLACWLAGWETR